MLPENSFFFFFSKRQKHIVGEVVIDTLFEYAICISTKNKNRTVFRSKQPLLLIKLYNDW